MTQSLVFGVVFLFGSTLHYSAGGSAAVSLALWTILKSLGLDAGYFGQIIRASMWNMWSTGIYLSLTYKVRQYTSWPMVVGSSLAQAPGAALGSYLVSLLPPEMIGLLSGCLIIFSLGFQGEIGLLVRSLSSQME